MNANQHSDKAAAIRIICEAFDKNPRINYILKQDSRRSMRLKALAEYAYEIGKRRNGVHLTDDKQGLAIAYPSHRRALSWYEKYLQIKMAFSCFSAERLFFVQQVETRLEKTRMTHEPYLYFWFFGVANEALGSGNAKTLVEHIFALSDKLHLPIYLETSLERNTRIYARYGFQIYNRVDVGGGQFSLWYMRRPCSVNIPEKSWQPIINTPI